jgi:hypothetical protein
VRSRTKAAGDEGNLMTVRSELSRVMDAERGRGVGQPKGQSPFYSTSTPIIAPVTGKFTFLPRRPPLTTVKSPKGRTRLLLGSAPAWAIRGSSEARFSPCGRLVVSSAHLGDGTASLMRGYCWGKWPSQAFSTSGRADSFGSRAASAIGGSFAVVV